MPKVSSPCPTWAYAQKSAHGKPQSQIVAHRGFSAQVPENTMAAFRAAVASGAEALETDIHLTRDEVVVLNHDRSLRRCFGINKAVCQCDWEEIAQLRTIRSPHEPMPRLEDLLTWLADPSRESVWVILDLKLDDDAQVLMQRLAATIAAVAPLPRQTWAQRLMLGCRTSQAARLAEQYLPGFSISLVSFELSYATYFHRHVPQAALSMNIYTLLLPFVGPLFLRAMQRKGCAMMAWTVNDAQFMHWSLAVGLDAILTDDPERLAAIRASLSLASSPPRSVNVKRGSSLRADLVAWQLRFWYWAQILLPLFLWMVPRRPRPDGREASDLIGRPGAPPQETGASRGARRKQAVLI